MTDPATRALLDELGIDASYGSDPYRPQYSDADKLVDIEPNVLGRMQQLTPAAAAAWRRMKSTAEDNGVLLLLVSGFRSRARQTALIRRKLDAGVPLAEILESVAAPGFSQHHTGETVDIATPGTRPLVDAFETTNAFEWLGQNAAEFGFRMPYPRGNRFGFAYEPWHWTRLRD